MTGNKLAFSPTINGGSGLYEYRIHTRKPGEAAWTPFANWTSKPARYNPGSYLGDICFRIEARDALAPEKSMSEIIRYRVVDQQTAEAEGLLAPTSVATVGVDSGSVDVGTLLAAPALAPLAGLLLLAWRRRRAAPRR